MTHNTTQQAQPQAVLSSAELGKLYADRDHAAQGEHYMRHIDAMTREGLHAKSAIAGELAHRDMEIEQLRAAVAAARKQGWDDCMALWADHMKRMNAAIAKPLPDGWANHAHHIEQNVREALKAAPTEAKLPNSN